MVMPDGAIGGFYTLSSTALRLGDFPEDLAKRLPRYPLVPATLLGRLAIDRRYHGQGWGSFLFLDALYRCSRSEVASFAVIVDGSMTRLATTMCITAFCRYRIRPAACFDA
jgi:GNAT superfamily N-acetyltransferase